MAVTIVPSLLHAGAVSATAFEITGGGGIEINPVTAVDSKIQFKLQGTNHFTMGVDESTPNNDWVLSLGSALGTNNVWSVDGVSGVISFTGGLAVDARTLTGTILAANVVTSSLTTSALTTVGTIGTGGWQGTEIGEVYGGTNQTSYTQGDLLYSSGANTLAKLGIGILNQQIRVSAGGIPEWFTASSGGVTTGKAIAMAIVF